MRRTGVLLSLALGALVVFVVFAVATAPKVTAPILSGSMDSPSAGPSSSSTPLPADPCHVGGVTYCALNPDVTDVTIKSTICVSGWTATIRPPESYTEPLKLQQMTSEQLPGSPSDYEEDHRMPLELGGAPRDPTNLSPESHATSYTKDAAENEARRQVCAGADLRTVQSAFVIAWLGAYPTYAK